MTPSSLAAAHWSAEPAEPAFVHRIRLRARRRILWLRSRWEREPMERSPVVILDADTQERRAYCPTLL